MSARRVRTPGNRPRTDILRDRPTDTYCSASMAPPSGYDGQEARLHAGDHGWVRVDGKDYCPEHAPTV